jgi:hypothetical protein
MLPSFPEHFHPTFKRNRHRHWEPGSSGFTSGQIGNRSDRSGTKPEFGTCLTSRSSDREDPLHETYRSDRRGIDCLAGNDLVRFGQNWHRAPDWAGRRRDSGQARRTWPSRPWAPGPRPSLRMVPGPRSSQMASPSSPSPLVSFRCNSPSPSHCPGDTQIAAARTGRAHNGAAGSAVIWTTDAQPNPISTAIRIRSEWFLAPSFCLSRDVVLATVL